MVTLLDKEMYNYFIQLNEAEKKSVVQMLKTFLQGREVEGRISIQQYNKDIDEAMENIDRGSFTTMQELEKEMKGW